MADKIVEVMMYQATTLDNKRYLALIFPNYCYSDVRVGETFVCWLLLLTVVVNRIPTRCCGEGASSPLRLVGKCQTLCVCVCV